MNDERQDPLQKAKPEGKSLIDCHVHLAALPDGDNGCFISAKTLKSPLFRFLLWKHGLSPDKPREANQTYLADLLIELRAPRHVDKAVLLGMDGVYDRNGRFNQAHTDFLIGNDYVLKTAQAHPNELLAGVSINPQRRDAVDEVHRCADAGAVLMKVLANAKQFEPAKTKCGSGCLPPAGRYTANSSACPSSTTSLLSTALLRDFAGPPIRPACF